MIRKYRHPDGRLYVNVHLSVMSQAGKRGGPTAARHYHRWCEYGPYLRCKDCGLVKETKSDAERS